MNRFKIAQTTSRFLPPLLAGYFREFFYPFSQAIKDKISFTRKSITGSVFSSNTQDLHSYWFGIHGFFDWRNILLAKAAAQFKKKSDIIEIGANIGTETIGFADIVGENANVHAFEPLTSNLQEIEKIKTLNKDLNIKIYPIALSNIQSTVDFIVPPVNYSGIGKIAFNNSDEKSRAIKVDVHLLDEYILKFNNVSGIFIDVEGHEYFVLEGAIQTINKFRPLVVLEVSESLLNENHKSSLDILQFFSTINYTCYYIGRFFIYKITPKKLNQFSRHANWICVPAGSHELISLIKRKLYKHILIPLTKI
jgi:FkbM family methyltransferase